jgi:hypothetical protein
MLMTRPRGAAVVPMYGIQQYNAGAGQVYTCYNVHLLQRLRCPRAHLLQKVAIVSQRKPQHVVCRTQASARCCMQAPQDCSTLPFRNMQTLRFSTDAADNASSHRAFTQRNLHGDGVNHGSQEQRTSASR